MTKLRRHLSYEAALPLTHRYCGYLDRFMDQLKPEEVAGRSFRQAFRGADTAEVTEFLSRVARQLEELIAQRDRLAGRLGEFAERDLKSEFAQVGEEVAGVLEAARSAAEAMRDRSATDAARWRTEAMAEAESERRAARDDAEHLRTDAWQTSEELLRQVQIDARRQAEAAERDSLSVLGEAEREAHRLTALARREADDMVRGARMEAERLNADATARHDEIIDAARKQAEASQERARALEQRRQELLTELEGLRSSLSRMEGELDERRTKLNLSAPDDTITEPPVRVLSPDASGREEWEPGETVRVVPKSKVKAAARPVTDPEEVVAEVRRMRATAPAVTKEEQAPPSTPSVESPAVVASEAPLAESGAPVPADQRQTGDDVGAIFSRLRGAGPPSAPEQPAPAVPAPTPPKAKPLTEINPLELRQQLLLPVANRALRNIKRQLTEMQNVALEELRVAGSSWRPERASMEDQIRPDLVVLMAESFSMGHNAAEELVGKSFPRPPTPGRDEAGAMTLTLVDQLLQILNGAGDDAGREVASSVSRVFRAWRTDEAERRVNDLASSAYHEGLRSTLAGGHYPLGWVVAGRGCARCRQAAEEAEAPNQGEAGPPLHSGCSCTLIPLAG
jgi:DivIVA domain-containing protein